MSNEKKDDKAIKITVDNEQTKKLAKELAVSELKNELLQQEKENPEPSLNDLKMQAIEKFGRADLWTQATSKAQLRDMITNFINSVAEQSKGSPSGSAPLNSAQMGQSQDLWTKKYEDYPSMIKELRQKAHAGNREAQSYLDQLLTKYGEWKHLNPTVPEQAHNPNSQEELLDLHLVKKGDFLTPENPENGDIGKILAQWKVERLRKMGIEPKGEQK